MNEEKNNAGIIESQNYLCVIYKNYLQWDFLSNGCLSRVRCTFQKCFHEFAALKIEESNMLFNVLEYSLWCLLIWTIQRDNPNFFNFRKVCCAWKLQEKIFIRLPNTDKEEVL